jgi:TonB family protein
MSTQTIESATNLTRRPGESPRQQSVCIEIPVTVHGSRLAASANPNSTLSGKTFVEETRTMIVFPQGAVLRLSENVAEGQILILKNPRVKQEVACRVVNSKTNAAAKGYVEVEFFQPTAGFWGIAFPSGAAASQGDSPAIEEQPVQVPVTPVAAPPKPVYSKAPVTPPPAPPHVPAANSPAAPVSFLDAYACPAPTPVPNQTLELNRAIVAAYANGQVPARKPDESNLSAKNVAEHSTKSAQDAEALPVVLHAPPPPADSTRAPEVKGNYVPPSTKSSRNEKQKSDAKPQKFSRDGVVSSVPVVTADSIDTEFSGYKGPRSSVKQSLSSAASASTSEEARKSDLSSEPKAIESVYGRQLLQSENEASENQSERPSRTWLLVGAAAMILLMAGGGTYWWRHTKASLASSKSLPAVPAPAFTDPSAVAGSQPASGTATNPQNAPGGSPQSQNSGANQKPNSVSAGAPSSAGNSSANKTSKPATSSADRHPTILPSRIVAPTSPATGGSKSSLDPAPDVAGRTPGPQNVSLGSVLSSVSAAPAPPPVTKSSGSAAGASVFTQPKLIEAVQPVYPKLALARGDFGDVTVDALVDQYGKVVATKVLTGPITLREAAVAAISQQRYQPAKLNGVPTSAHVMITIQFKKKS